MMEDGLNVNIEGKLFKKTSNILRIGELEACSKLEQSNLNPKTITICIENENEKITMTCSDIKNLKEKSEYFCELLDNMSPSDEEIIHLPEEDVYEACGLLSDILKRSRGEGTHKIWNQAWAKLSAKVYTFL
jgi:hypothetical protein